AEALKAVSRRARPDDGRGTDAFGRASFANSAFPSGHATMAWSLLTPVAESYDAPWLYGVAAITSVGRVVGRAHWLSDVVAGSALGWWIGDAFHRHDAGAGPGPSVAIGPHAVAVSVPFR
ncbi:MAG TPA: phosphatase PAP2 family protein, partial [Burkholderiaceae bacterium]